MKNTICILISANAEWRALLPLFPQAQPQPTPYGDWFDVTITTPLGRPFSLVYFHGGWGKIAAAGSTQYVIDRWDPALLVNLGTCGGFRGQVEQGAVILAERTLVYDIIEQMSDPAGAIQHYATTLDLSWLHPPYPLPVCPSLLVSADRDLLPEQVSELSSQYGAVAGDWESGAIAYVASHNRRPLLILRAVTDLVGPGGDETYGNYALYEETCRHVMQTLTASLPAWLDCVEMEVS